MFHYTKSFASQQSCLLLSLSQKLPMSSLIHNMYSITMQSMDLNHTQAFNSAYCFPTLHPSQLENNASLIIKLVKPADEHIGYDAPITVIITDRTCSC